MPGRADILASIGRTGKSGGLSDVTNRYAAEQVTESLEEPAEKSSTAFRNATPGIPGDRSRRLRCCLARPYEVSAELVNFERRRWFTTKVALRISRRR